MRRVSLRRGIAANTELTRTFNPLILYIVFNGLNTLTTLNEVNESELFVSISYT